MKVLRHVRVSLDLALKVIVLLLLVGFAPSASSGQTTGSPLSFLPSQSTDMQSMTDTETLTDILITDQGFSPSTLTVPSGSIILWTNLTEQTQRIEGAGIETQAGNQAIIFLPLIFKNDNGDQSSTTIVPNVTPNSSFDSQNVSWQSEDIPPDGTFSRAFDQPGQYRYKLSGSSDQTGVIVVEPASPDPLSLLTASIEATGASTSVGLATPGDKDGGLSWGDFNDDGCLDVLVNTNSKSILTRLYQQESTSGVCNKTFADVTSNLAVGLLKTGVKERSAIWGDVNNDGYLDFAVNRFSRIEIYLNKGPAGSPIYGFGDASGYPSQALFLFSNPVHSKCGSPYKFNTEAMGWVDYDSDGDLDLIADNHNHGTVVFQNDGFGHFFDIAPDTMGLPGCNSALSGDYGAFTDFDVDGDVDFLDRKEDQFDIWKNDRTGHFTVDKGFNQQAKNQNKGGAAFCDFDSDGDFDLFWTDSDVSQIWVQDPASKFSPTGLPSGISGNIDDVACGDVDNDGDLDLFLTSDGGDQLFLNTTTIPGGPLTFVRNNMGIVGKTDGEGAAFADYDRDGDLDLLINQDNRNELWDNPTNNGNYLIVRALRDLGGGVVRDDIGATLELLSCEENHVAGVREVNGGRGHGSQDPAFVHFGLPSGPSEPYVVKINFIGGTTVQRAVVPGDIGSYQFIEVKDTDHDDLKACQTEADLILSKHADPNPVTAGEILTYTLTLTNTGPDVAENVVITDTLPLSVAFDENRSSLNCLQQPDDTIICPIGDLPSTPPANTTTVTIVVTTSIDGPITNRATASSDTPDPLLDNNADILQTTMVIPAADLALSKTDAPDPVTAGESLTFTLTLTNYGPSRATGVTVTDPLADAVMFDDTSSSPGCTEEEGIVTCDVGELAKGASTSLIVGVTVDSSATDNLTNTATVSGNETDSNPDNNTDLEVTSLNTVADLVLAKSDEPDPVVAGGLLTYTLTITNNGPSDAIGVLVTDTLPATFVFDSVTPEIVCNQTDVSVVHCNLGRMAAGGNLPITIVGTTTVTASGTITNTATVTSTTTDSDLINNTDIKEETTVIPVADLAVAKRDALDPIQAGQTLTYTIIITNNGPSDATGIVVTDTLPTGVTFNAANSDPSCSDLDETIICTIAALSASPPNISTATTIAVTVDFTTVGTFTNVVTVSSNEMDPDPSNNTASEDTTSSSAFVVTNTNDDGPGSLRQAILNANANPGLDTITFDISGSNPYTVTLTTALPNVTDSVSIDGTTQNGASCDPFNLLIELDGGMIPAGSAVDGLNISAGNSLVRGLKITGFSGDGIKLNTNNGNRVECNIITGNDQNGVQVVDGLGNTILNNNIFENGQLGIDLGGDGPTPNDSDDPNTGANGLQNFPVITRAFPDNAGTTVEGRLASKGNTIFELDFFGNDSCDPTGFGEGQTFLGTISVTTNITGHVSFTNIFTSEVPSDQFVTATATDSAGNTSEFSQCTPVSLDNDTWPRALRLTPGDSLSPASIEQYLDKMGQSRWYKFTIQPSSQVIVTLTNLPENYDLTVYKDIASAFKELSSPQDLVRLEAEFAPGSRSPDEFAPGSRSPDAFAPGSRSPDIFAPDAFSSDAFAPGSRSPDEIAPGSRSPEDFSSAQTRSLLAVSAFNGTASEGITVNTWNNTGDFYVRVRGRNGAFSLEQQFRVEVTLLTGTCSGVSSNLPPSNISATNGNFETIILIDLNRMEGSNTEKATLQARLNALAGQVNGVIVDVGADDRVTAANAQADANVTCPYANNLVAESIKEIVDKYRATNPIEYIVLVGNDAVIPFFRYPDNASLGPESDYVPPVFDFTASEASLRSNYVLGQDAYGSSIDLSFEDSVIPIPDLAVGRLVETPSDVIKLLDVYLATGDGVVPTPSSALVTGYDFIADAALAIETELEAGLPSGTEANTLITARDISPLDPASWTADQLRAELLDQRHDLIFLGGHFSANSALAADYQTRLLSTDLTSSAVDLENAIVFSIGCHSGYNIVNNHGIPGVTREPDWAQAFAQKGATLIAGTGYQYGDTDFIEYGERLYLEFSRELRTGTGAVSIGQALIAAKQTYLADTPQVRDLHEKTLIQTTLFGLPMLKVSMPGARLDPTSASPIVSSTTGFSTNPGATLGLRAADVDIVPNFSEQTVILDNTEEPGAPTVEALVLRGTDGLVTNPSEPALPLEIKNVSVAGTVLRGIGFRGGAFVDRGDILPFTGAPTTEIRGVHTPFPSDVFFPVQPWNANYLDALMGGDIRLMVTPAQYKSTSPGSRTSTLRQFNQMNFRLYYSNNIDTFGAGGTPALASTPSIVGIVGNIDAGNVNFKMNVVGDPAAGIQEVWVTYTATSGPFAGKWQSLNLTQSQADSTLWEETLDLNGTSPEDVRYMVQAVNGVGLVELATNLGAYYIPGVDTMATLPTEISLQLPASSDAYGSRTTFSAILTSNGIPLSNQLVSFGLGSQSGQAITDDNGQATVTFLLLGLPGNDEVKATFAGSSEYIGSFTSSSFGVTKRDTMLSLDPKIATGLATDDVLTIATLTEAVLPSQTTESRRLNEQTVFFVVTGPNGSYSESVITDYLGRAPLGDLPLPPGDYDITAYFGGAIPLSTGETIILNDSRYNSAIVTGKITLQNSVPIAVDDIATTDEDTAVTIDVLANDSDAEQDTLLTVAGVSSAANGTVVNNGSSVTYTPNPNFNGTDRFTYRASDGIDQSDSATVTVTVKPVNDTPVAKDDTYNLGPKKNEHKDEHKQEHKGSKFALIVEAPGVLGNDRDVDGDALSAIRVNGPDHGTLILNPDGSFVYTPNANFSGVDTFTYKANDSKTNSSPAIVTIQVIAPKRPIVYVSSSSNGRVDGISFADEDILAFDTGNKTWSMYFDGSDVGIGNKDTDAFFITKDGDILISFQSPASIPSLGKIETSDIVKFIPTSLGHNTAGRFEWYFDGSSAGLTKGTENIDAIGFTSDGRLVISTAGPFQVESLSVKGEDLVVFSASNFGPHTSGVWDMYFDGSDVGLSHPQENIWGTWIDANTGDIYLTTKGDFSVPGLKGSGNSIFICHPESLGVNTTCNFGMFWDGLRYDFGHEIVDGFSIDLK